MDYLNDYGLFVFFGQTNDTTVAVSTAPAPWGPWTVSQPMSVPDGAQQYPSAIAGLCPKYDTAGLVTCTMFMNGNGSVNLYVREAQLGPLGPAWTAH